MQRIWTTVVLVALAGTAAALTAALYRPGQRGSADSGSLTTTWQQWYALSKAKRLAYVLRYRAIAQRADAAEVLRRARAYAALPDVERQQLRTVYAALQEMLARQPAAQRSSLRSMHERARAEEVYRILEREGPGQLTELREELGGES